MDELNHSPLVQFYHQLEQLLSELQQPPFQVSLSERLSQFSKQWLMWVKTEPDLLFAQTQLHNLYFSSGLNLSFNRLIYTTLLASRNKLDDSVHQQLLCAIICVSAYLPKPDTTKLLANNKAFPKQALFSLLKSSQWQLCRHGVKVWPYLMRYISTNTSKLSSLDSLQAMLFIAVKLAKLTTFTEGKSPLNFALAFKKVCSDAPQNWYAYLRPLLIYPGLIPPGTCLKDQHDNLQLCLALKSESLLLIDLTAKNGDATDNTPRLIQTTKVTQLSSALKIAKMETLSDYWGAPYKHAKVSTENFTNPWSKKTSLSTVPHSLLAIQTELNAALPDVDNIVEILEQEPAFSAQLQNLASANNRLMLPIVTSRHGLLINGFDRSYQALLQHSLLSRLTQDTFPLQNKLLNFTQLFCFTADELVKLCCVNATELTSTIGLFALSYFFISPQVRTRLNWKTNPSEHYKLSHLFALEHADQFGQFSIKLAKAWQQPAEVTTVLQQLSATNQLHYPNQSSTNTLVYIMRLALIGAREIYFAENHECEQTTLFKHKALIYLKLAPQQFTHFLTEISHKNQVYCSLTL